MASVCLGVLTSGASAADVSVRGNVSETLEASDNYFLINSPSGTTFKSLSAVNLDVIARTPGTRILFASNLNYYNYFGQGASDTSPQQGIGVNEVFRIDHTTDLARYFFAASWQRANLATTQLIESGVATGTGDIDTFRAAGGVSYEIGRADSISWSGQASRTTFTGSSQTPYNDLSNSVAWDHLVSPTTTWTTSVSLDWYDFDDLVKSQRLFWQLMTGIKSQLTRRLTVTASVGESFANTWQNAALVQLPGTIPVQTGAASGTVGLAGLTYEWLKTTTITASVGHLIVPLTTGQLQKTTTASFGIGHSINAWSNLAFFVNYAHTDNSTSVTSFVATGPADFFSAQLAYSYQIARDWRTSLSYTFRQREDDTGTARSSTVLLSLAYDFNAFGNPNAFDPVDAQRALVRQRTAIGQVFPTLQ
jgi:hypothetical protein